MKKLTIGIIVAIGIFAIAISYHSQNIDANAMIGSNMGSMMKSGNMMNMVSQIPQDRLFWNL